MNVHKLIDQIRAEIHHSETEPDLLRTIANVLMNEGIDLRREPSLDAMKYILVEAVRCAEEGQSVAC